MSVMQNIARSYRNPGQVVRDLLAQDLREPQVLFFNLLACGLIFIVQLPRMPRLAEATPMTPEELRSGLIVATLFILPLLLYGIAGAIQLALKLARVPVPGLWVRLVLFWSLLCVTPLMLLHGGLAAILGPVGAVQAFGFVVAVAFIYITVLGGREIVRLARDGQQPGI